jgi:hypothetical protein
MRYKKNRDVFLHTLSPSFSSAEANQGANEKNRHFGSQKVNNMSRLGGLLYYREEFILELHD